MTLTEAVQKFVHEGSTVAFGGMGGTQCVAHAYEIARQRIGNLTLICESPAEPADILIGAGLVKKAEELGLLMPWLALVITSGVVWSRRYLGR